MKEIIELQNEEDLAIVLTIKTKKYPNGISYIRQDCINRQFLELDDALKNLRNRLRATKIIL